MGLVSGIVFLGVLGADFVMWDDDIAIYRNPHLTGISLSSLAWAFSDASVTMRYVPLSLLAWSAIHEVWGLNPVGYHLANWLLHIANTVLLFFLARFILVRVHRKSTPPSETLINLSAFSGTLFWAINPLRVETVAWATTLTYGLATFFILSSLLAYMRALTTETDPREHHRWMGFSLLLYTASLLSHPIGMTYFLVLPVIDFFVFKRTSRRKILVEKGIFAMPAVGIALFAVLFRLLAPGPYERTAAFSNLELLDRFMQMSHALAYYVWRSMLPVNLSPVYTTFLSFDPLSWKFLASMASLLTAGMLIFIVFRKKVPAVAATAAAFLVLALPVTGLLEHPFFHSDRYAHLATIPLAVLLAGGLHLLLSKYDPKPVLAVILAGLCAFSLMSAKQVRVWSDSEALFTHAIKRIGNHPYRGDLYMRLGKFRFENNQLDAAAEALNQALDINPYDPVANDYLSEIEFSRGQHERAIGRVNKILERHPENYSAHAKLAYFYHLLKEPEKAAFHFSRAKELQRY